MDHLTLSLAVGAAAGALVAIVGSGKESRPVPTLLNAVLVGFLISVAERYLA